MVNFRKGIKHFFEQFSLSNSRNLYSIIGILWAEEKVVWEGVVKGEKIQGDIKGRKIIIRIRQKHGHRNAFADQRNENCQFRSFPFHPSSLCNLCPAPPSRRLTIYRWLKRSPAKKKTKKRYLQFTLLISFLSSLHPCLTLK